MVENHLLRGQMIVWVLFEDYAQVNRFVGGIYLNLTTTKEALIQKKEPMENMNEDRD